MLQFQCLGTIRCEPYRERIVLRFPALKIESHCTNASAVMSFFRFQFTPVRTHRQRSIAIPFNIFRLNGCELSKQYDKFCIVK